MTAGRSHRHRTIWLVLFVALGVLAAACGGGADAASDDLGRAPLVGSTDPSTTLEPPTTESTTTTVATTTTTTTVPTTVTTAPTPTTATPSTDTTGTTVAHPARMVVPQAWVPYATAGPVTLHLPSDHTEAVGFHQSGHDGAMTQLGVRSPVRSFVMEDRGRQTTTSGAADIVVEPGREVRSPVTGVVIRGGTYTLYCDHVDQYVVIEPDARPGWQVKVLHVEGLALSVGQRVEAGVTRLAAGARVLPFASQVEDHTGLPAWPHVHVEVVDPSIPDRPTGPGCP